MKNVIKTLALAAIAAMALTGCIKHEPYGHRPYPDDGGGWDGGHGGGGGSTSEKLLLTKQDNWTVRYVERYKHVNDDGTVTALEHFRLDCAGATYVFPLIISPENLKGVYGDKLLDFFTYEVGLLQDDAKANPTTPLSELGVYSARDNDVYFNRQMHGTWLLFVPELDSKLNLTGRYAEYEFTIREEEPTEAYKRWLGTYHVTDLEGYGALDIVVSDADANYLYYVHGWETGPSVTEQMKEEGDWIYARFDQDWMFFYAQFVQTDEYDGTNVDEVFAGTYLSPTSGSNGDLDWEGVDYEDNIAYPEYEGDQLMLKPCTIKLDNGYSFTYVSMRYSRLWFTDNGKTVNWAFYNNSGVPRLPAAMTFTPETRSSVSAPAVRKRTKATVHRDQLKPVRTVRQRRAMGQ